MGMKKFFVNKFKFILLLSLIAVLSVCSAMVSLLPKTALADTEYSADWFLPNTELEYFEPTNPTDAISSDDLTAVMNTNSLTVYYQGKFASFEGTTFTEIERHKNSILISSEASLYKIPLSSIGTESFGLVDSAKLSNEAISYFKANDKYLVTSYATYLRVFSFTDNGVKKINNKNITVADKSDVAINDNNQIFFVDGGIRKIELSDLLEGKTDSTLISTVRPKKMVATNDFIYYIDNDGNICRLPLNAKDATQSTFALDARDSAFDLGKLSNAKNLAFRNGNLLITDSESIQEFYIDNENNLLTFTGFAIAKNKTAYNRISVNATEIEKYQNTIAILDGTTLKVVDVNDDIYNRENFAKTVTNLSVEGANPDTFSLGASCALLLYSPNTSSSSLRLVTFDGTLSEPIKLPGNFSHIINDVTYQSGCFYALASNGSDAFIYKMIEGQSSFELLTSLSLTQFSKIAVDVFDNVILTSSNRIVMLEKANSYQLKNLRTGALEVKEIKTDLNGDIFMLVGNSIYHYSNGKITVQAVNAPSNKIKSFALDAFSKDVFFIYDGDEYICTSNNMVNFSFEDLLVPSSFITSGKNADLNTLKVYSALPSANVYCVTKTENGFSFDKYHRDGGDYLYICSVTHSNGYNTLSMKVLAGQDSLVLVNDKDVADATQTLNLSSAPQTVYITTSVSGYFLPLITVNSDYALNDNGAIVLQKGVKINPLNKLTFLDRHFYFAEFTVNNVVYKGYVPASFTVETLAQDFKWQEYSVEKVKKTALYSDESLTEKIIELEEDCVVRVIKDNGENLLVAVSNADGEWIQGYINASAVKDPAGKNVKNILIVLIVAACVLGTTAFFLLRKKKIK